MQPNQRLTTLGLQPSPLSTQIKRLEHDLGGELLVRAERGRPMQLTPFGNKVAAAIRASLPKEMTPT
ncbi:LysR family transcriptional regulator [Amycolatopsis endophytica]|uniref:LysR family transcriptional regulator n=1 Tax=Amycolatopsis endophytica TaxID=860233 RepID=UPI0015CE74F8